jgi:hypothetical protein
MTEAKWLTATDPQGMLGFVWKTSERKMRLFAVACCRRVWRFLPDERSRRAVETAERFADGQSTTKELEKAADAASAAWDADRERVAADGNLAEEKWDRRSLGPPYTASAAAYNAAVPLGWWGAAPAFLAPDEIVRFEVSADSRAEGAGQCDLLRDIFGNPFRPIAINPAWLNWNDGTVRRLATAVYQERELPSGHLDVARMGVLADALEDAGCADLDLLAHLRGLGPHVRGCWVIDLLTGRE